MRGIVAVCLCALLTLAADHPNPPTKPKQTETAQTAGNSAQNVAATDDEKAERTHRQKYEAECSPAHEKRDSDLCAQWKAADAAADSAWWAARATWVGGISGLLVLIALGLAFEANRIARKSAQQQLRAYVSLQEFNLDFRRDKGGRLANVRIQAKWKNSGQTPATHFNGDLNWGIFDGPLPEDFDFPLSEDAQESSFVIGPGLTMTSTGDKLLSRQTFADLSKKKSRVFVWVSGEYLDAFEDVRRTEVAGELIVTPLPNGENNITFDVLRRHNAVDGHCMKRPKRQKNA